MKQLTRKLQHIVTVLVFLASCSTSWAGDIIGEISAVSRSSLSIDSQEYQISNSALVGKGPNQRSKLRLDDLAAGQVVKFRHQGERISRLELMHGESELPN